MATEKNIMVSLDLNDPVSKKISEILGNKTSKKILNYLAENPSSPSQKDLADALNIPLNTVEYNLKKLIEAGLVEKTKEFFWSKKGKKILTYKLTNKSIVISPKKKITSKLKTIAPVAILSVLTSVAIRQYSIFKQKIAFVQSTASDSVLRNSEEMIQGAKAFAEQSPDIIIENGNFFFTQPDPIWIWFLAGSLIAIFIFALINWRKL
ncbi:winged helix-turn-helix domain-containing protein [Candidatus Pacearchaeota archaeon]|nr:winged helix-turn-helix domain-containing protein [Candidatus Pacearchaeota archaeon]